MQSVWWRHKSFMWIYIGINQYSPTRGTIKLTTGFVIHMSYIRLGQFITMRPAKRTQAFPWRFFCWVKKASISHEERRIRAPQKKAESRRERPWPQMRKCELSLLALILVGNKGTATLVIVDSRSQDRLLNNVKPSSSFSKFIPEVKLWVSSCHFAFTAIAWTPWSRRWFSILCRIYDGEVILTAAVFLPRKSYRAPRLQWHWLQWHTIAVLTLYWFQKWIALY